LTKLRQAAKVAQVEQQPNTNTPEDPVSTTTRTIVKTTTPGWYIDVDDPDGKRVRKAEGDNVITRDEYWLMKNPAPAESKSLAELAEVVNHSTPDQAPDAREAQRQATVEAAADANNTTQLSSGKLATGPTVTIKCAWVDPVDRTPAQQRLFEGPVRDITYDGMVQAAGGDPKAMPDGTERVIKKQDQFQVRFTPENQRKHRNELKRRKLAQKRAARQAAQA
jgi:hypothetical protein